MAKQEVEVIDISELTADPNNARKHTERNIDVIGNSLQEVGAWRSIAIDENNMVHAGNGVIEAAAERGFRRVMVVESDGQTLVAVRRRGMTDEQKQRAALYDNRAAELAEWVAERIAAIRQSAPDALAGMFTDREVARLIGAAHAVADETTQDADWTSQHLVVIECASEGDQTRLLERLMGEGLQCRALTS